MKQKLSNEEMIKLTQHLLRDLLIQDMPNVNILVDSKFSSGVDIFF